MRRGSRHRESWSLDRFGPNSSNTENIHRHSGARALRKIDYVNFVAERASPESITPAGSMDSGPAHPSRLLPTWTMIVPNSGKPEFGGASRNDGVTFRPQRAAQPAPPPAASWRREYPLAPHRYV